MNTKLNIKDFTYISLITSLWIIPSELLRYFLVVRPEMMDHLSVIPNMGKIFDLPIMLIWGVITIVIIIFYNYIFWLCAKVYGNNRKAIIISSIINFALFGMFWLTGANMFLSSWSFLPIVYPLIYLETIVASIFASKLFIKKDLL